MTLIDTNKLNLDRIPRAHSLSESVAPCWESRVDLALGQAGFHIFGDSVLFTNGKNTVWRAPRKDLRNRPLERWSVVQGFSHFAPGHEGATLSGDGRVFIWGATGEPKPLWRSDLPEQLHRAEAFAPGFLFVNESAGRRWSWGAVDTVSGHRLWAHEADVLPQIVPSSNSSLIAKGVMSDVVRGMNAVDGQELWSAAVEKSERIIGIVDENCWVSTRAGTLVAVSTKDGSTSATISLTSVRQTRGVLQPGAKFVFFSGGLLQIVDLRSGESLRSEQIQSRDDEPRQVNSNAVRVVDDGRLIFTDSTGGLWSFNVASNRSELIDRRNPHWYQCAVHQGFLFALAEDGLIRCYGSL